MTTFPKFFPADEVLDSYDITGKQVHWLSFLKKLSQHHLSFHEPRKFDDDDQMYLCQSRSVFHGFTDMGTVMAGELSSSIRGSSPFEGSYSVENCDVIIPCDEEGQTDEYDEDRYKRELRFFIPAFIWEYSEAKKALTDLDKEVYAFHTHLNAKK